MTQIARDLSYGRGCGGSAILAIGESDQLSPELDLPVWSAMRNVIRTGAARI